MIDRPIGDIMKAKAGPSIVTIPPTATVFEAVALMDEKRTGSVLVREAGKPVAGIFTERDLMRRVVRLGRDPKATTMKDVMTPDVRSVPMTESTLEVLRIMVEYGYRHMLVMETETQPWGVVSIRDLMAWLIVPEQIAHEGRRGVVYTRAADTVQALRGS
ncbi:MAG: CBS domain-containing protein [Betaproteobacteria bacterium]|nr:CBS domain-containing protein [Betaproteobacteria bacterium]